MKHVVAMHQQPHVLKEHMEKVSMKHGDKAVADIYNVRIGESALGLSELYFCPMVGINIKQPIQAGDGGGLPERATLSGRFRIKNLRPGLYNLNNVVLNSNGTIQVIARRKTRFELIEAEEW